jgi:nitrogen fixation/metabolism regulation signal transduction histidine kinase
MIVLFACVSFVIYNLFQYISRTNRKLVKFLNSIQYSDFALRFSTSEGLDKSFTDLNVAFNKVVDIFKKERQEKTEHLQYLNTIVNHVNVGLISFGPDGSIDLLNKQAKVLLNMLSIFHLNDIKESNEKLHSILTTLSPGESTVLGVDEKTQLAIFATTLKLSHKKIKIFAIQNIYKELLSNEVQSWQKLASVLRHEIMNSITPINSINSTLLTVVNEDFSKTSQNEFVVDEESYNDLQEGLITIDERTKSLVDFVNSYQDYTNIPKPVLQRIQLEKFLSRVHILMKNETQKHNIRFEYSTTEKPQVEIIGDVNLLEMVIINLVKNSTDALSSATASLPQILMTYGLDGNNNAYISVSDNGVGITPEELEKIFIPFYTTKKTGTGIGLSLSRQIIEMHNGSLTVKSTPDKQTTFMIQFYKSQRTS